jgi:hypothetical protein
MAELQRISLACLPHPSCVISKNVQPLPNEKLRSKYRLYRPQCIRSLRLVCSSARIQPCIQPAPGALLQQSGTIYSGSWTHIARQHMAATPAVEAGCDTSRRPQIGTGLSSGRGAARWQKAATSETANGHCRWHLRTGGTAKLVARTATRSSTLSAGMLRGTNQRVQKCQGVQAPLRCKTNHRFRACRLSVHQHLDHALANRGYYPPPKFQQ